MKNKPHFDDDLEETLPRTEEPFVTATSSLAARALELSIPGAKRFGAYVVLLPKLALRR